MDETQGAGYLLPALSIPFDPREHKEPYLFVTVVNGRVVVLQGPPDSEGYFMMMTPDIWEENTMLACLRGIALHRLPETFAKRVRIIRRPGLDEDGLVSSVTYYQDDTGRHGSFQARGYFLIR